MVFRMVIFFALVLAVNTSYAQKNTANEAQRQAIEDISGFPSGVWKGRLDKGSSVWTAGVRGKPVDVVLHVHAIDAVWGRLVQNRKAVCVGELRESKMYSEYLSRFDECINTRSWIFKQVSEAHIVAHTSNGEIVDFHKTNNDQSKIDLKKLKGVWKSRIGGKDESIGFSIHDDLKVYADFEFLDGDVRLYKDEAGVLMLHGEDTEFYSFIPLNFHRSNRFSFWGESDEGVFKKTRQKPASTLIVDDYGRSMKVNALVVDVTVMGDIAETTVDVLFTNTIPDTEEAQFSLPLPSNAVVSAYSLEVKGELVPGVAIPKSEAQEVFETLQNRGVDPGLAKVSENNQFSTEVYPIEYGQQRRIKVTYVESLNYEKGKHGVNQLSYYFPLDAFGSVESVKLALSADSVKAPSSNRIKRYGSFSDSKLSWSKIDGLHISKLELGSSEFQSPLKLAFSVSENAINIFESPNGNSYFAVSGKAPIVVDHSYSGSEVIDIAWDLSSSMKRHHEAYIEFLIELRKRSPYKELRIFPFHISSEPLNILSAQLEEKELRQRLESLFYDGAADIGLLKEWVRTPNNPAVIFSDAMHTDSSKLELGSVQPAWVVYPNNSEVNMPLITILSDQFGAIPLGPDHGKRLRRFVKQQAQEFSELLAMSTVKVTANCERWKSPCLIQQPSVSSPWFRIVGVVRPSNADVNYYLGNTKKAAALSEQSSRLSSLGEYLWVKHLLAPLLATPRDHRLEIERIGLAHGLSTPYTTLIVLEDLEDYVEFGIKPPKVIDPLERYSQYRKEFIEEERHVAERRAGDLVNAWQDRLYWYKEGKPKKRTYLWSAFDAGDCSDDCPLEEVVVMGIKASLGSPSVHLEPWQPNTPYMVSLRAAQLKQWENIYESERIKYEHSMSFYMDVAKYLYDNGLLVESKRVLSNILELFPQKPRMERLVAYVLQEMGDLEEAKEVFEHLYEIAPHQASSMRDLALIYERQGMAEADQEMLRKAIRFYYEAAVNSVDDPYELPVTAIMEMNNLIKKVAASPELLSDIDPRLMGELCLDLRITLAWTNEFSMVDLYVTEPSGETVEWKDRVSKIGAWLPYDSWGNGPVEYLLKKSIPGEYKVKAVYWSDDGIEGFSPIGVIVTFYLNYGKDNEKIVTSVIRLESVDEEYVVGKVELPTGMSGGVCSKR